MTDDKFRRGYQRYDVDWGVQLSVGRWKDVGRLTTGNISRGGLFVCSEDSPEKGTRLTVKLSLPDGGELQLMGEVAHSITVAEAKERKMAPGFGVRFDEKHVTDLSLLEAMAASYVQQHEPPSREYISVPAQLEGPGDINARTSAHHLVPQTESAAEPEAEEPAATANGEPSSKPADPGKTAEAFDEEVDIDMDAVVGTAEHVAIPDADGAPPSTTQRYEIDPKRAIFGIDFGTSFTSIALVTDDEQLHVLPDEEGQILLPSVVSYPDRGSPLVGWPAKEQQLKHPTTTFVSPKRLIGRQYDETSIQPLIGSSPIRFSGGPNGKVIADLYGEPVAMVQVCAEIFRRIAQIGQRATGVPVRRVVISTPVGYDSERVDLQLAAKFAGLEVVAMVAEPNAAAIAYGLGKRDETVAVYDFGGGTFDFTLVRIEGRRFQVMGQEGDAWLGGDDFDIVLASHAAAQFEKERKLDLRKREVEWQRLLWLAERAKRQLSTKERAEIFAKGIVLSIRGPIDLKVEVTRERFAELCGELVERSMGVIDGCLTLAGINPQDIDQVVMVGGVSRIPLVRDTVANFFGKPLQFGINPEQAIVMGNAIFGRHHALAQR